MTDRLEWIAGPHVVARREEKLVRGVLTATGPKRRLLIGQLRDRELGNILTWVMFAPRAAFKTTVRMERLSMDVPRAKSWTFLLNPAFKPEIPPGFTIPPDGSPFERGLII